MDVLAAVLCIVVIVMLISIQRNRLSKVGVIDGELLVFQATLQKTAVEHVRKPEPQVKIFTSDLKILD